MSIFAHVVTLKSMTGLPKDDVKNTFWCGDTNAGADPLPLAITAVIGFVNAYAPFINGSIDRANNACKVDSYLLQEGAVPAASTTPVPILSDVVGSWKQIEGSPRLTTPFTLTGPNVGNGNSLPNECAICLSYHADLAGAGVTDSTGRPRSRRSGRLYIGPLTSSALISVAPAYVPVVATNAITAFSNAFTVMTTAPAWGAWGVYSRTEHIWRPIVGGFVDNAFDTQRRRGVAATLRQALVHG